MCGVRNAEFNDPRLVPVYDAAFGWSREDDFFLSIVNETPAASVLDLGCGTGRLALGMAVAGHAVTGVDPARASLDAARTKPGAERVTWIEGTSTVLRDASFGAAVMTSHVTQFFIGDDEWMGVLADLRRSLIDGGVLVFDTRDPAARGWERWTPAESHRRVTLPNGREVEMVTEVACVRAGLVDSTIHYRFSDGTRLQSSTTLRFRTESEVRESLHDSGFAVERVFGGWALEPIGAGDGELLVIARADQSAGPTH